MQPPVASADRAITDYFISSDWNSSHETVLLTAIFSELMQAGKSTTVKSIIASIINKLESEGDDINLQSYRNILAKLMAVKSRQQRG